MNNTMAGVDLAKDVIQACIVVDRKVRFNTEMTSPDSLERLINSQPRTVAFKACRTSNYRKQQEATGSNRKQQGNKCGHDSR